MAEIIRTLDSSHVKPIKYGSEEHANFLRVGYDMTKEEAEELIAERKKDPNLVPYEMYKKARAFLEQLASKPSPTSDRVGWKRQPVL